MEKTLSKARVAGVFGSFKKKEGYGAAGRRKRNEVRPGTLHALHQPLVVGLKLLEKDFFFFKILKSGEKNSSVRPDDLEVEWPIDLKKGTATGPTMVV